LGIHCQFRKHTLSYSQWRCNSRNQHGSFKLICSKQDGLKLAQAADIIGISRLVLDRLTQSGYFIINHQVIRKHDYAKEDIDAFMTALMLSKSEDTNIPDDLVPLKIAMKAKQKAVRFEMLLMIKILKGDIKFYGEHPRFENVLVSNHEIKSIYHDLISKNEDQIFSRYSESMMCINQDMLKSLQDKNMITPVPSQYSELFC
jgi:hypothetical protein